MLTNDEEKRDFIRMQFNSEITLDHGGTQYTGVCKDLSGTGLLVEAQQGFDIGTELKVSITPRINSEPHEAITERSFNAITEVMRSDSDENDLYTIGLSIKQII